MNIIYKIKRYETDSGKDFISSWKKGDICEIRLNSIDEHCCKEMKIAMKEGYIIFGEYESFLNSDINLNILLPYFNSGSCVEMPIKYCPFCSKEFKLIEG